MRLHRRELLENTALVRHICALYVRSFDPTSSRPQHNYAMFRGKVQRKPHVILHYAIQGCTPDVQPRLRIADQAISLDLQMINAPPASSHLPCPDQATCESSPSSAQKWARTDPPTTGIPHPEKVPACLWSGWQQDKKREFCGIFVVAVQSQIEILRARGK